MTTTAFSFGLPGSTPSLITDDASVSFVIEVLVDDGLHVAPFTQHSSRTGPLQQLGLTGDIWDAWLREIVDRFERFHDLGLERSRVMYDDRPRTEGLLDKKTFQRWQTESRHAVRDTEQQMSAAFRQLRDPVGSLVGPPALTQRLGSVWKRSQRRRTVGVRDVWLSLRKTRRGIAHSTEPGWPLDTRAVFERLGAGRQWRVLFVPYPGVVLFPVGNSTILCGSVAPDRRADALDALAEITRVSG